MLYSLAMEPKVPTGVLMLVSEACGRRCAMLTRDGAGRDPFHGTLGGVEAGRPSPPIGPSTVRSITRAVHGSRGRLSADTPKWGIRGDPGRPLRPLRHDGPRRENVETVVDACPGMESGVTTTLAVAFRASARSGRTGCSLLLPGCSPPAARATHARGDRCRQRAWSDGPEHGPG